MHIIEVAAHDCLPYGLAKAWEEHIAMDGVTRRTFTKETLGSLLTLSLLETVFAHDAFSAPIKPITVQWLADLNQIGRDVKDGKITQVAWQAQVEHLFARVDLPALLRWVDFDKLTAQVTFRERGERRLRSPFPEVEGLPTPLVFGHQIFALKQGRSIVPHGHDNMATAFLILQGTFHGRHYERLADDDDGQHMIIKPTIDRSFSVGQYSTISDHKDNVHWFQATSASAFIFNIHVLHIDAERGARRVYIDPHGTPLSGGWIRARRLKSSEAYKLYG